MATPWNKRISKAVDALKGKKIRESSALLWGADPDRDLSAAGGGSKYFRPLTQSPKDIKPYDHQRMLEIAVYLYQSNPLAKRIIERRTNYILGEGVVLTAKDKKVQEVLDDFWSDPHNRLDRRLHAYVNAWRAYGDLILTTAVNPSDGKVRLGFISPDRVEEVVPDPYNIQDLLLVNVKAWQSSDIASFKVVRMDEDPSSKTFGTRQGEVFFFTANTLPDMIRGMSDLWSVADYCDGYETTIWDLVERAGIVNAFVIHVTKEGADQEDLEDWWLTHGSDAPRAGEVIATNEKEKWEFLTPDFTGQNIAEWSDLILSMIATGADMPKFWLNAQLDPNRAAAEQMAGPVVKGLTELQREFVAWMTDVVDYVIDQAIMAKTLTKTVDRTFEVVVPEISGKDMAGAAQVFLQATQALSAARAEGLIDKESARRVMVTVVSRLGTEITLEDLVKELEKEEKEKEAEAEPMDAVPYPDGSTPGVPGAENTGNATKGGAPRKTPTPRTAHSEPDGSQAEAAPPVGEAIGQVLEAIEELRDG